MRSNCSSLTVASSRRGRAPMKRYTTRIFVIVFSTLLGITAVSAGPMDPGRPTHPKPARTVHEAEHTVDYAWEVYHRAALGGTVASPTLQAEIEQHLHEARTLISEAQKAAELGDKRQVQRLVSQINIHTSHAIEGSKEQKK